VFGRRGALGAGEAAGPERFALFGGGNFFDALSPAFGDVQARAIACDSDPTRDALLGGGPQPDLMFGAQLALSVREDMHDFGAGAAHIQGATVWRPGETVEGFLDRHLCDQLAGSDIEQAHLVLAPAAVQHGGDVSFGCNASWLGKSPTVT
jgi:hypothetical protein